MINFLMLKNLARRKILSTKGNIFFTINRIKQQLKNNFGNLSLRDPTSQNLLGESMYMRASAASLCISKANLTIKDFLISLQEKLKSINY